MQTIEELLGNQADASSSASRAFDDDTLLSIRQAPEGQTAYDLILAALEDGDIDSPDDLDNLW